jgi:hypothetical protein
MLTRVTQRKSGSHPWHRNSSHHELTLQALLSCAVHGREMKNTTMASEQGFETSSTFR